MSVTPIGREEFIPLRDHIAFIVFGVDRLLAVLLKFGKCWWYDPEVGVARDNAVREIVCSISIDEVTRVAALEDILLIAKLLCHEGVESGGGGTVPHARDTG